MNVEKKSADIVSLTRNHLPIGVTDPAVIDLLVSLLGKAERGELLGLTCAWVEGNNDVVFQIKTGSADAAKLVAAVTGLFYEINRRWQHE